MRRATQTSIAAIAVLLMLTTQPPPVSAEVVQKRGVRVSVEGELAPTRLPRHGESPVSVSVAGRISSTSAAGPPQLRTLTIAINRNGHLSSSGIPLCRIGRISPSTTQAALEACGSSLVGEGSFSANVKLPEQSPFPSEGKILAFNGRLNGRQAILAHIYGSRPAPTSYVLPFLVKPSKGTFGTVLEASLPTVTGDWGYVTGIAIELDRRFTYRGKARSFLSAACPAPSALDVVAFPLIRASFGFDGGLNLTDTLTRTCRASG